MNTYNLTIEFCPKCNWLMRSAWLAQELMVTFENELEAITLKKSETAGKFAVLLNDKEIFDRKTNGGFPEPKILKQIVREKIAPEKSLGHSDSH
ncbi:MAG: SelT/SelW/SelH family protein [Leadbetterella sp.]